MRSDPRTSLRGPVICSLKVLHRARISSGPNSTHAKRPSARTKPKQRSISPRRIKSGTIWERRRPRRRPSTQKTRANFSIIRNPASLIVSPNPRHHPGPSISRRLVPPTHHRQGAPWPQNPKSHTSTNRGSLSMLQSVLLSPLRNSPRARLREHLGFRRCRLVRTLDSPLGYTLQTNLRRSQRAVRSLKASVRATPSSRLCHYPANRSNFSNINNLSLSIQPGYHRLKPTALDHRPYLSRHPRLRGSRVLRVPPLLLVNHQTSQCSSTRRPCNDQLPYSMSQPPFLSMPGKSFPSSRLITTGKMNWCQRYCTRH